MQAEAGRVREGGRRQEGFDCSSIVVAQATRLFRPATRRTKRERQFEAMRTAFSQRCSRQFRSAGRRPRRAGRPSTLRSKQALAPVASERATEDGRHPFSTRALRLIVASGGGFLFRYVSRLSEG